MQSNVTYLRLYTILAAFLDGMEDLPALLLFVYGLTHLVLYSPTFRSVSWKLRWSIIIEFVKHVACMMDDVNMNQLSS